ncbi:KdsC family phosphatase [Flaviaesturariibacter aridisoli]|uniref:3-deoxy-D-manno-octulosonate 8-phosphate phosphatase n=1 Tax=Flaviaesturariibacter aridisoli TaxID=2545761 RepID=A0A4R4E7B0_9BACT|nr:HAD family hydrolase [Flaviaesturariibacter aridisoli]TCZ73931.1 3-deoxy-D-manno-octulosonate 8-phosphate phosphatase [Flaviaesturariibacter aridisoli]
MELLDQFKAVKTFVFDVDGVLTDSTVLLLENGLQARRMNIKDGLALQLALRNGYRVVILSGAYSAPVVARMQYLGLTDIFTAVKDKKAFLERFAKEEAVDLGALLFMGDDLPDLPALAVAGLPCCPADAVPEVLAASRYIATRKGGDGCVREVIEKVLRQNGHWHYEAGLTSK